MPTMSTIPFTMRLDEDIKRELEAEAKLADRSASYIATKAIKEIQEAIAEADKGAFISEEKMTEWFESLGTDNELPEPEPDVFLNRT